MKGLLKSNRNLIIGLIVFEIALGLQVYFGFGYDPLTFILIGFNFNTVLRSIETRKTIKSVMKLNEQLS